MGRQVIVNFATQRGWFPKGQKRLKNSLVRHGWAGDLLLLDDNNFVCPNHKQTPYGFKAYVLKAMLDRGYDQALWVDASFWAKRPLESLFETIKEKGVAVQDSGYPLGQWMSDSSLTLFGLSRDQAMLMPMYSGGLVGLDFTNPIAVKWVEQFYKAAKDGRGFRGPWRNRKQEASQDKRCSGHRHDMVVGSILMSDLDLSIMGNNRLFAYHVWWRGYHDKVDYDPYFLIEGGCKDAENFC